MIPLPRWKDRKVRVVGLGPGGRAAAAALKAAGAEVTVWDDDAERRAAQTAALGLASKGPRASLSGLDAVVLCDGALAAATKALLPKVRAGGVPLLTDFDLFAAALDTGTDEAPRIVGVTGAAGKSVTVRMIAQVCAAAGRPVHVASDTPCLGLPAPRAGDTYVVEMPPGRLAATRRFACDVAVVLEMESAKGGLDAAMRAVTRLVRHQRGGGATIVAADDGLGAKLCAALQGGAVRSGEVIPVSSEAALGHGVFVLDHQAYAARDGRTQSIGDLSRALAIQAPHLALDAAAAIAACLSLGVSPPVIVKALHDLEPAAGRFAPLGNKGRVLIVDDSRARLPQSVTKALAATPDAFWVTTAQAPALTASSLRGTFRVGEDAPYGDLAEGLDAALAEAEALAARDPQAAPVVLFAPCGPTEPGAFARLVADRIDTPTAEAAHG